MPLQAAQDCVVLLHGWARLSNNMAEMAEKLQRAGFLVSNISYPSMRLPIRALAVDAIDRGLADCRQQSPARIHFVAHSLGGILVRAYLQENRVDELGVVVMLGTPNQGVQLVDRLSFLPGFGLLGPASQELASDELVTELPPVSFDTAVIAGDRSINPLSLFLIAGPDDGVVSVASTRVEGMSAHLVLPAIHQTMPRNNRIIDHVIHYLKTGAFIPE